MEISRVIIGPVISEKSMSATARNSYTFLVNQDASKKEIAAAVEDQFKVDVLDVRVVNLKGKKVRFGKKRIAGQRSDKRKAIVIIKPDQKIEAFDLEK